MRVCPTDAVAVAGDEPLLLQVVDEACIRCGQCLPACPHGAVKVNGEIGRALAIASAGRRRSHPEPGVGRPTSTPPLPSRSSTPAMRRASAPSPAASSATNSLPRNTLRSGKRSPGAPSSAPPTRWWWRRCGPSTPSSCPTSRRSPCRRWRRRDICGRSYGAGLRSRTRASVPRSHAPDLDAAITFGDLDQLFRIRGVSVLAQPTLLRAGAGGAAPAPERGRRAAAGAAGGGALLEPAVPEDPRAGRAPRRWPGRWRWTGSTSASWTS